MDDLIQARHKLVIREFFLGSHPSYTFVFDLSIQRIKECVVFDKNHVGGQFGFFNFEFLWYLNHILLVNLRWVRTSRLSLQHGYVLAKDFLS